MVIFIMGQFCLYIIYLESSFSMFILLKTWCIIIKRTYTWARRFGFRSVQLLFICVILGTINAQILWGLKEVTPVKLPRQCLESTMCYIILYSYDLCYSDEEEKSGATFTQGHTSNGSVSSWTRYLLTATENSKSFSTKLSFQSFYPKET